MKKQPQPLRLQSFLNAANDFYNNLGQDEIYSEHIKSMELCLQHAIVIMGDAVNFISDNITVYSGSRRNQKASES